MGMKKMHFKTGSEFMSKLFEMKDKYRLGVKEIDDQHEKLFMIGDDAYELLKNSFANDKYDKILNIFEELKAYTIEHFKSEEEYMEKIGYKKLFSHKIEHQEFIQKVSDIDFEKIDSNQDEAIMEILNFLAKWLEEHILEKDLLIVK